MTRADHVTLAGSRSVLGLLAASHFMLILDSAIVGVALPSIGRELHFRPQDLAWVPNAYTLLYGGFLILGGRLCDLVGRRRMFVAGQALFTAASLLGGLASSPGLLILARGLQGLAAAMVAPAALSLGMAVFPDHTTADAARRGKAMGVIGTAAAAGGSVGLLTGGVLTDLWGWESIFYVNVPIGLLAMVLARPLLPTETRTTQRHRFDVPGAVTITAGLTLLVYVLINADDLGLLSPRTLGLGALAVALLATFLIIQKRHAEPLVPLWIFRIRSVRGANTVALLINMVISPLYIILSLYLQEGLDFSAFQAGMAVVPLAVVSTTAAACASGLVHRFGVRMSTAAALLVFTGGVGWLALIDGGSYQAEVLGPLLLIGAGGIVFVAFTIAGTARLEERVSGVVTGVLATSQQLGAALGLAVLTAVATIGGRRAADSGPVTEAAVTDGYRVALLVAVGLMAVAIWAALRWLPGNGRDGR